MNNKRKKCFVEIVVRDEPKYRLWVSKLPKSTYWYMKSIGDYWSKERKLRFYLTEEEAILFKLTFGL